MLAATVAAVATVLAVVVAVVYWTLGRRRSAAPSTALVEQQQTAPKPQRRPRSANAKQAKRKDNGHADCHYVSTIKNHTDAVTHLQFSPGGQYLASISADRTLRLWASAALEVSDHQHQRVNIEEGLPSRCSVSADGKYVLVAIEGSNSLLVYGYQKKKGKDGKASRLVKAFPEQQHSRGTTLVSVDLSAKYMLTCGAEDVKVNLLSLKGTLLQTIHTNQLRNNCARFNSTGELVAVAARTNEVKVWKVQEDRKGEFVALEKKMLASVGGHSRAVTDLGFNGATELVTCSLDGSWKVWDVDVRYEHGEDPHCIRTGTVEGFASFSSLALSGDGRYVALLHGRDIAICTVADARCVHVIRDAHGGEVTSASWDSQSNLLATGAVDHLIRMWRFE